MPQLLRKKQLFLVLLFFNSIYIYAQQTIDAKAIILPEENKITIQQTLEFTNTSSVPLTEIYLSDWNNSSSTNTSEFAKHFAEEFKTKLHYAHEKERGITQQFKAYINNDSLKHERVHTDIIKIVLKDTLYPSTTKQIKMRYELQLPNTKFTNYGIDKKLNIILKDWLITPAEIINNKWKYYPNKDLNDLFVPVHNLNIELIYPDNYTLASDLDLKETISQSSKNLKSTLKGENRINYEIHLTQQPEFVKLSTDHLTFVTNIESKLLNIGLKAVIHDKVSQFLQEKLGSYPFKKLILSNQTYKRNPVYGLNQLPSFIRPYPEGFQYEIKIAKASISNYIANTLHLNPREDYWLLYALETYLLYQYVEEHYPNMKALGTLAKIWGIRYYELAKKKFNDQYEYMYQYMARINLNQSLETPRDSLLKFNEQIALKNKAGLGLVYLNDYLDNYIIPKSIQKFYQENKLKNTTSDEFITLVQQQCNQNLDWFIPHYIKSNKSIDYTITESEIVGNQLQLKIKNTTKVPVPFSIYSLENNKIIEKHYIEGFSDTNTITIPHRNAEKVIINYEGIIPEINQRNNTKTITPSLFNKTLKFSFLKDAEAAKYNQVFYTPQVGYNLYDGLLPGIRFSNIAILKKPFSYSIRPTYGMKSKKLIGSVSGVYTQFIENKNLFSINYGVSYQTYHYQNDLLYQKFDPYLVFSFRNKNDLRSNFAQRIIARYVTVNKEANTVEATEPNYNVLNAKYIISNRNLFNSYSLGTDIQFSENFGKISTSLSFRKTFKNNQQINARLFGGVFFYNNTNSDFFSYALDRPTDYLFDYDYYGRSESTGIFSQQIIIAEGGFKSKLNTPFANKWMSTLNLSTSVWKYILAYGDLGVLKNNQNTHFVYDSGIHINLVPDYFELYFPVYSKLGWEIAENNYHEKIRVKIVLTPKILTGLFTRKWL